MQKYEKFDDFLQNKPFSLRFLLIFNLSLKFNI